MNRNIGPIRRRFGKLFVGILFTSLSIWFAHKTSYWLFTIRFIEVQSENAHVIVDEKRISKNLLFFPTDTLRMQVLAENPGLSDVRFEKRFPATLRIIPTFRQPIALLLAAGRTVLVDKTGVVIRDGEVGNALPRIEILTAPFRIGETLVDKKVQLALALITAFSQELRFTHIAQKDESSLQAKTETLDIIVAQDVEVGQTLSTLQTLLAGFRIKGTLPKVVDLRFDKPIVTF